MPTRFNIEKQNGEMPKRSRQVFREQWDGLSDGWYTITIEESKRGYTSTRYKYYFDCMLFEILRQAGQYFRITSRDTGEERQPSNANELHEIMKRIYNPIHVMVNDRVMVIAGTTTDLADRDFIGNYMEQIIADHSGPPYLVDIPMYEEWKEMRKAGMYK